MSSDEQAEGRQGAGNENGAFLHGDDAPRKANRSVGTAIAYYFLSPVTFDFFAWLDLDVGVTIIWTSETCIEMLLTMMIISGLLCEIPLLIAGMAYLDVLSPSTLLRHWRGFTFGSIALGAIVSPGNDLASMAAFSGLVLGIYLVSIVMAFIFHRKTPVPGKP